MITQHFLVAVNLTIPDTAGTGEPPGASDCPGAGGPFLPELP